VVGVAIRKASIMAQWMWNLGSLHQFRNVPYVEHGDDGTVICLLCGTGWMYTQQRARHFHGENHRRRFNHVQNLRLQEEEKLEHGKRVQFALSLEPRIDQLGLKRWRDTVRQSLYRYITKGGDYDNLSVLEKFERKETLSLLELAVWKAQSVDGWIFRNTEEIREQQALDEEFDASAYLKIQRILNGCHVIVPKVASFL
jgi:hypothetical protein